MQYNQPQPGTVGYPYPPQPGAGGYPYPPQPQPPSYEQAVHVSGPAPVRVQVQGAQPPPVVIIQHQAALPVGPDASFITCPHCHVQKLTRVEYAPSVRTHCMAALLCLIGLWCFACLPYCATSCMNANHFCGNCNKFVGVYNSD
ncbi:lipopolysaccharide-induced tumor necrosis factor-alpha factor homolog [Drosophila madeirensis]|uniref:Lipopolysaccharide-induced tumor necrosis factor-alpha factor homolog n=1 Tax=Drosophila madeirensis TaxID=30013 RepID=A0AAU9GCH8_DROMD